jgi:hypothetical protein
MSSPLWNIEAESSQVSQMGKLYQRADRVVAWIGREEQEKENFAEIYTEDAAEAVALWNF